MVASLDGSHPVLQRILHLTDRLAASHVPILVVGEEGSGRETLARVIHTRGGAPAAQFVVLDCRTIRLEDVSLADPLGRLLAGCDGEEVATIFFREVAELPASLQHDLAGALLGARCERSRLRVIASNLSEPQREVEQGRLCQDLCDALLRVTLFLPPLRERRCDIPNLVQRMLEDRVARGEPPCRVTTEAMVLLWEHDWPGNVGELKHLIDGLAATSRDGLIHAADLPPVMRKSSCAERRPPASISSRLRFAS